MLNKLNKNFDNNIKKIKKLKMQLTFTIFLLLIILVIGIFIFLPVSWQKIAIALTGNYSKVSGTDQLTVSDWNNLPNDFLDKQSSSGDTMAGPLTLSADPTTNMQAATKQYVDNNSGGGGGDTFVNWGRGDCPSGTTELYNGYSFGVKWSVKGGGSNPVCIKYPLIGTEYNAEYFYTGYLHSIGSSLSRSLPVDIPELKEMKCAKCFSANQTCFENIGDNSCPSGFNIAYTGWLMGGISNENRENQLDFICVNDNFDGSINNINNEATIYGATIEEQSDLGFYTENSFIRCSVCCGG